MKSIIASFLIFFIMIFSLYKANNFLHKMGETLDSIDCKIEETVIAKKWDEASKITLELDEAWAKQGKLASVFIHHNDIDLVTNEIKRLEKYISTGEQSECLASIATIETQFRKILDLEKVTFQNIF